MSDRRPGVESCIFAVFSKAIHESSGYNNSCISFFLCDSLTSMYLSSSRAAKYNVGANNSFRQAISSQ